MASAPAPQANPHRLKVWHMHGNEVFPHMGLEKRRTTEELKALAEKVAAVVNAKHEAGELNEEARCPSHPMDYPSGFGTDWAAVVEMCFESCFGPVKSTYVIRRESLLGQSLGMFVRPKQDLNYHSYNLEGALANVIAEVLAQEGFVRIDYFGSPFEDIVRKEPEPEPEPTEPDEPEAAAAQQSEDEDPANKAAEDYLKRISRRKVLHAHKRIAKRQREICDGMGWTPEEFDTKQGEFRRRHEELYNRASRRTSGHYEVDKAMVARARFADYGSYCTAVAEQSDGGKLLEKDEISEIARMDWDYAGDPPQPIEEELWKLEGARYHELVRDNALFHARKSQLLKEIDELGGPDIWGPVGYAPLKIPPQKYITDEDLAKCERELVELK